ncbi:MAG: hypothetical protein ABR582_15645 [Gemmatimonadaceae bacterium]
MYSIRVRHLARPMFAAALAIVLTTACSDATGSGAHQMSLSFTTKSAASVRASTGFNQDIVVGTAGELVLKKIQIVLDRIELAPSGSTVCAEDDDAKGDDDRMSGDDDCEEMARDPILVNVPLDDAVRTVVSVPVAAGTFTKLEARVDPASAADVSALGAPADMTGKSIRVEGKFKGTPFVFTSPLSTRLEFEFDPPLVIDASTRNATVSIDVTKWFIASDGSAIDPATANAGGPNSFLVAGNIRNSFDAFEDDDMHGDNDHEGEGGSSGHH